MYADFESPDEPVRPRTANSVKYISQRRPRSISVSATVPAKVRRPVSAKPQDTPTYQPYPTCDVPHLTKTPWELERHKKASTWKRSTPTQHFPANVFKKLPREIYNCILAQLEHLHLRDDQACLPCYLKDLYSLSRTSRAWDKAARSIM